MSIKDVLNNLELNQAQELVDLVEFCSVKNWVPATSSNFSIRGGEGKVIITQSSKDKSKLSLDDLMIVDIEGVPKAPEQAKPSAEMALHLGLYEFYSEVGCVAHTHSLMATLMSKGYSSRGQVILEDLELLKALEGNKTHETIEVLPIFQNTQDIDSLRVEVNETLQSLEEPCHGYLIEGHGLYTWGKDVFSVKRQLEALEYMLQFKWHTEGSRL